MVSSLGPRHYYSICRCFLNSFDNTGEPFKKDVPKINLGNDYDYIEAKINLEPTNRQPSLAKQNVFSVGQDISVWSTTADGKYNIHFYYPNATSNDYLLRFSTVAGEKVNNVTRRTKGIIKIPSEVITIRICKYGIMIDGHLIEKFSSNKLSDLKSSGDEGNYKFVTEEDSPKNTYFWFIDNFLMQENVLEDLEVGSMEGKARSWAYYEYIMYHIKL